MTNSTFRAISASALERLSDLEKGSKPPLRTSTLNYVVKLEQGSRIALASGGDVRDMHGYLSIVPDTLDRPPNSQDGIGFLKYWPESNDEVEPESVGACIWVPADQLQMLSKAAQAGHIPGTINLDFDHEGIEIDWMPDGSGLKWDNVNHRTVTVLSAAFNLELVSEPTPYPDQLEDIPETTAPTHQVLHEVSIKLAQHGTLTKRISTRIDWIAISVVVLVAIALWKS